MNDLNKNSNYCTDDEFNKLLADLTIDLPPAEPECSLFGIPRLNKGLKEREVIYILDNEEDCNKLNEMGLYATTIRSSTEDWNKDFKELFIGARVVLLLRSSLGSNSDILLNGIKNYVWDIKVFDLGMICDEDLKVYFEEGNTIKNFIDTIELVECNLPSWRYIDSRNNIKINSGELANIISKNISLKIIGSGEKGRFYLYEKGVYREISVHYIKSYVARYILPKYQTSSLINDVTNMILVNNSDNEDYEIFDCDVNILNFKNGLYDIKNNKLLPHTPNYFSVVQIDGNYNPNYKNSGNFDNYKHYLVNGVRELMNMLQEFMGLSISNYYGNSIKSIFVLCGQGNTGKSKFLEIIQNLLGKQSCINVPVQDLNETFALGNLGTARFIFDGDLPSGRISDGSLSYIKKLTGGDSISVQKKNKDLQDVKYKGTVAFACNKLPALTGDFGDHVFSRIKIIPCNENPIPEDKQIKNLMELLNKDKEYIIFWAIEGLKRLIANDFKLTYSKDSDKAVNEYRGNVDTVRDFIDSLVYDGDIRVTDNSRDRISSKDLYVLYRKWAADNGHDYPVKKPQFAERLKVNFKVQKTKYNGNNYYTNIKDLRENLSSGKIIKPDFKNESPSKNVV